VGEDERGAVRVVEVFGEPAGAVVEYGVDLGGPGRTWQTESEVTQ
jgi:hypothetical protein